jgi:hypothetical protein
LRNLDLNERIFRLLYGRIDPVNVVGVLSWIDLQVRVGTSDGDHDHALNNLERATINMGKVMRVRGWVQVEDWIVRSRADNLQRGRSAVHDLVIA